ncbi:MAG: hypothetical protein WKF85_12910, partial [Chitinophagaceae bacterium]
FKGNGRCSTQFSGNCLRVNSTLIFIGSAQELMLRTKYQDQNLSFQPIQLCLTKLLPFCNKSHLGKVNKQDSLSKAIN